MTENETPQPDNVREVPSTVKVLKEEYLRLMHAMQTGVEYLKEYDTSQVDTKHLKVGVNSALVSNGALVGLLIEKGLITEQEFWEALVKAARQEVLDYQETLQNYLGPAVVLL